MKLVEREESELALSAQATLLQVARSSLYYKKAEPSEWEIELKRRIDLIYTDFPFYGSRRIKYQLGQSGFAVNRRTVQRYMQEMGLEAIAPGPNLSKRNLAHKVYPYLLRNVEASYPNHIWGIEIVRTQMTKTDVFTARAGRYYIPDLYISVIYDNSIY